MDTDNTSPQKKKPVHHGRNVRRLRELLNMRQDELADKLNVVRQKVSRLESQEVIAADELEKIAVALNMPVDAIKNLTNEKAVNMISNSFTDFRDEAEASGGYGIGGDQYNNINTIEKLATLYDKLLAEKDDTVNQLEKIIVEMNEKLDKYRG